MANHRAYPYHELAFSFVNFLWERQGRALLPSPPTGTPGLGDFNMAHMMGADIAYPLHPKDSPR